MIFYHDHQGAASRRKVGVCLGGKGSNLPLMARVATALAERDDATVHYLTVVPQEPDSERMREARQNQIGAIRAHASDVALCTEILRDDDPLETIVGFSHTVDVLVIGSVKSGTFESAQIGSFASRVAERAHCSVVIVHRTTSLRPPVPWR